MTKTPEVIDVARWMHAGNIAEMDDEGFVKIKGRIKDVVIRGGENLFPKEIEDFLYTSDAVCDVQVIGVPDIIVMVKTDVPVLFCMNTMNVPKEGIRQYCAEHISHNKVPRYVRFFSEFPMTASGKAQKFKLREFMREELNLKEIA